MTTLSFEDFLKQAGGKPNDVTIVGAPTEDTTDPGFFSRVSTDLKKRYNNIADSAKKEFTTGAQQNAPLAGGRLGLRIAGQAAGGILDIGGEALKSLGDVTGINQNVIKPVGTAILNTELGQKGLQAINSGVESYNQFKTQHPDVANALGDVLNIATLLSIAKAPATKPGLKDVNKTIADHIAEAKDVITENIANPSKAFEQLGGEKALIERAKINIVDGLKEKGLADASGIISKIDIKNVATVDDFAKLAQSTVASELPSVAGIAGEGVATGIQATTQAGKDIIAATQKLVPKAKVLASDAVTPLEKGVQTVLESTKTDKVSIGKKLQEYTAQAEKALADYSQKTPLELAGEKAQGALTKLSAEMKTIGQQKKALTETLGNIDVRPISKEVVTDLQNKIQDRLGVALNKAGSFTQVAGRLSKVSDKADLTLIKDVISKLKQSKSFQQLDDAIDYSQDLLFKRRGATAVPINTQVESILKSTIKKANDMLKKTGGTKYENLNIKYANRANVFNTLNKALGLEGNKGASLMKQLFSPSGTAPRKLFEAVKKLTGVNLVEEATLAKFVMENIGDVRQASLLEQVLKGQALGKSGLIRIAADKILNTIQNPIGKAGRIIENRPK